MIFTNLPTRIPQPAGNMRKQLQQKCIFWKFDQSRSLNLVPEFKVLIVQWLLEVPLIRSDALEAKYTELLASIYSIYGDREHILRDFNTAWSAISKLVCAKNPTPPHSYPERDN